MFPKRSPVKKAATAKKSAAKSKKKAKKKAKKEVEAAAPVAKKRAASKKTKDAETIRLVVEADEEVITRFKTLYGWFKAEMGESSPDAVGLLIFKAGLQFYEESLEAGGVAEQVAEEDGDEEKSSGNLMDLDDELTEENPEYDDAFEALIGA